MLTNETGQTKILGVTAGKKGELRRKIKGLRNRFQNFAEFVISL